MGHFRIAYAALLASLAFTPAAAEEFGTPRDAESMVRAAVAHVKKVGKEQAYFDFTFRSAPFMDRDLYVVVYGLDGRVFAHGQNARMVGREVIELKDADGKPLVKERVELAKAKGTFWHDYKYSDPVSNKVLPKAMYCERLDNIIVCTSILKRT
jgi:signal transduction histidine kinase